MKLKYLFPLILGAFINDTNGAQFVQNLEFDGKDELQKYDFGANNKISYQYSSFGVLDTIHLVNKTAGNSEPLIRKIEYHADGSIKKIHLGGSDYPIVLNDIDKIGRLVYKATSILEEGASSRTMLDRVYGIIRDSFGNILNLKKWDLYHDNVLTRYIYSDENQLIKVIGDEQNSWGYVYDINGNIIRSGKLNPLTETIASDFQDFGPYTQTNNRDVNFAYDDEGRIIKDDKFIFSYNRNGRLEWIREIHTGDWIEHYLYDVNGYRVRKTTTDYVIYYNRDFNGRVVQAKMVSQTGEQLSQINNYYHGGNLLFREIETSDSTESQWFASDYLLSNVVSWNDQVITQRKTSPYGVQNEPTDDIGFTGHEHDILTKNIYMKARYYDPERGRFMTPDPIRDTNSYISATNNLYQYALNNPVNKIDLTGQYSDDPPSQVNSEDDPPPPYRRSKANPRAQRVANEKSFKKWLAENDPSGLMFFEQMEVKQHQWEIEKYLNDVGANPKNPPLAVKLAIWLFIDKNAHSDWERWTIESDENSKREAQWYGFINKAKLSKGTTFVYEALPTSMGGWTPEYAAFVKERHSILEKKHFKTYRQGQAMGKTANVITFAGLPIPGVDERLKLVGAILIELITD